MPATPGSRHHPRRAGHGGRGGENDPDAAATEEAPAESSASSLKQQHSSLPWPSGRPADRKHRLDEDAPAATDAASPTVTQLPSASSPKRSRLVPDSSAAAHSPRRHQPHYSQDGDPELPHATSPNPIAGSGNEPAAPPVPAVSGSGFVPPRPGEKPPPIPQRRNSLRNTKALTIMTPTVADLASSVAAATGTASGTVGSSSSSSVPAVASVVAGGSPSSTPSSSAHRHSNRSGEDASARPAPQQQQPTTSYTSVTSAAPQFVAPPPPGHYTTAPLSHYHQTSSLSYASSVPSPRGHGSPFAKPLPLPKTPDVVRYAGIHASSPPIGARYLHPHDSAPSPRPATSDYGQSSARDPYFPYAPATGGAGAHNPPHSTSAASDTPRSPHPYGAATGASHVQYVSGYSRYNSNVPPPSPSSAHPQSHAYGASYSVSALPSGGSPGSGGPATRPEGSGTGSGSGSGANGRAAFLATFEALYDAATDEAPRLAAGLREQLRKSASLLQTLQASGHMIEGLVRACFRDMQLEYGERFGSALADLNRRLEAVEARVAALG
ncbi:hypothetical protein HK405_006980, partial [Cladochytrium tenue]